MENNSEIIRGKILSLLRIRGPSLPIHISKETNLSTLFSSAFLAELSSNKTIKISNLKVGGSPLYFLAGQESMLENFSNYLPGKEKEAFSLLKEKKFLEDRKLEPAIRVALRSIKDFAFPLILNYQNDKLIFWRFHSLAEEEAKHMVEKIIKEREIPITIKPEIKPEIKEVKPEVKVEEKQKELKPEIKIEKQKEIKLLVAKLKTKPSEKIKKEIEKPLITIKEKPIKIKKPAEKSEFVKKIISLLETENIELTEEKEYKKKDYLAIIRINSDIGKIKFLLIAKDKKTITENDLSIALQKAQSLKMPSFLLSTGQLNKKALSYLESFSSLIKFRRI